MEEGFSRAVKLSLFGKLVVLLFLTNFELIRRGLEFIGNINKAKLDLLYFMLYLKLSLKLDTFGCI